VSEYICIDELESQLRERNLMSYHMALYTKVPNLYSLYTEVLSLYNSINQCAKSIWLYTSRCSALTSYGFLCGSMWSMVFIISYEIYGYNYCFADEVSMMWTGKVKRRQGRVWTRAGRHTGVRTQALQHQVTPLFSSLFYLLTYLL
jgi:hypothetical protein